MGILNSIKKIFTGEPSQPAESHHYLPQKSSTDRYIEGLEAERAHKDHAFRMDPHSPIPDRTNFDGLDYYPPNPDYRYALTLQPTEKPEELIFQTSTGEEQPYSRVGTIEFEVEGQPARLAVYKSHHHDSLFLPFRDATSGNETYGAGRYLEPHELGGGELLVDFNLGYNPFCAYSDAYSCPLPPFENHLKVAIRAGEKGYKK